jgi:hypothetical protein
LLAILGVSRDAEIASAAARGRMAELAATDGGHVSCVMAFWPVVIHLSTGLVSIAAGGKTFAAD